MMKLNPLGVIGSGVVEVASITGWELDLSKEQVKVTAFGDTNQIYVEGLPDIKGSYKGWFDPADGLVIFDVIFGAVKPYVELIPDRIAPTVLFGGKANIGGKITVDSGGGVSIGGSITANGNWVIPSAA
jgi:hypothetical protein